MEELFNLNYKQEIEDLKEKENFEELGDKKYIYHKDMEARLYWAFCRPSGSHENQLKDPHPLVSIMAFNHSRLPALKRFTLLHKDVIKDPKYRIKIAKRSRMLFRDLVDNDFKELNLVLDLVPVYIDVAIDQLKNGRKWNDIPSDNIEATKFIQKAKKFLDDEFFEALYLKLTSFEEFESNELKEFLENLIKIKDRVDETILKYYQEKSFLWIEESNLHTLQKKSLQRLSFKVFG